MISSPLGLIRKSFPATSLDWTTKRFHPLPYLIMCVLGGAAIATLPHSSMNPDVGWIKKTDEMANLRWPYNKQYKRYSPNIDYSALKAPEPLSHLKKAKSDLGK